jgi:diaminopimelate decarboxylase
MNSACDIVPGLLPALRGDQAAILGQPRLLQRLVHGFGSPLNIIFPRAMDENLASFKDTFDFHRVNGRVFFTSKPVRSRSLVRYASLLKLGIDVSSVDSLRQALGDGFRPDRISATGPKNIEYILLAVQQGIVVAVDSIEELSTILLVKRQCRVNHKVPLVLRINGAALVPSLNRKHQHFGISEKDLSGVLELVRMNRSEIDLLGISYHLNISSLADKQTAIGRALDLCISLQNQGFALRILNVGGGYPIRYAESAEQWEKYVESLKSSVIGGRPSFTWNDNGLGFRSSHGVASGSPAFVDHYPPRDRGDELCAILKGTVPTLGGVSAGTLIRELLLELHVEPGRSLLDQAGLTLARVAGVKAINRKEVIVRLEMNRTNLNSTEFTLLTDPLLVGAEVTHEPLSCFLTGNLCIENDQIMRRKVVFPRIPQPGDIVAFMNTAPYLMDFAESATLSQRTAHKVAIWWQDGEWQWTSDDIFSPLDLVETDERRQQDNVPLRKDAPPTPVSGSDNRSCII